MSPSYKFANIALLEACQGQIRLNAYPHHANQIAKGIMQHTSISRAPQASVVPAEVRAEEGTAVVPGPHTKKPLQGSHSSAGGVKISHSKWQQRNNSAKINFQEIPNRTFAQTPS